MMNSSARQEYPGPGTSQWKSASRWVTVLAVLLLSAVSAHAQDAALSATAIAWAAQNIDAYNQYHQYAHGKQSPQVPVPPLVDPPCHVCGDTTQTQGEAEVAAWVTQSEEPENTYIAGLQAMDKEMQLFGDPSLLTPAAQKALRDFEDDAGFINDVGATASELMNKKAIPMAEKYDKEPKQAYAGTMFLLAASKEEQMFSKDADHSGENEVLQLSQLWEKSITDKIEDDVLSGHKYNLCPVYGSILRTASLLGGQDPANMAKAQEVLQKLQDLVKFNVDLDLKVTIDEPNGSHMHADWTGNAKLTLNLDLANSCYTPVFDNGAQIAMNVNNWDMINVSKTSNGGTETTPVMLSSSHSYNATLAAPLLNLCDPQPLFQMPMPTGIPQEQVTAKGKTENTTLFGSFMGAVVAANEINSKATNAVTGGAPTLPGGSPSPSGSDSSGMDKAKALVQSHAGDVGWLMSAEGQVAIANLQKLALNQAQTKMAAKGVVAPTASTFAQLGQTLSSAHLPWTNGQAEPVNKTLHVKKDSQDITLTISVQQAAQ